MKFSSEARGGLNFLPLIIKKGKPHAYKKKSMRVLIIKKALPNGRTKDILVAL